MIQPVYKKSADTRELFRFHSYFYQPNFSIFMAFNSGSICRVEEGGRCAKIAFAKYSLLQISKAERNSRNAIGPAALTNVISCMLRVDLRGIACK